MPKRTDIKSVIIIGAGPIVIGQACEFDYSGTQACRALKKEGYRVILINSNPATIMTDPDVADATYIEPITPEFVEKVIAKEKPDALLPTMGGQTALNTAVKLAESGVLEKYNVEMIGASLSAIEKAEDRSKFRVAMAEAGLDTARSEIAHNEEEAAAALEKVGLPVIIRPSFTLGGTGGGAAYNKEEFFKIAKSGLEASPTNEILIEESLIGWKEYEMEAVRDKADNAVIVCSIENIDPMGVHTGDSITVAPALTLTDKEYQRMRDATLKVLRVIGVETGGSNVQFAVNPNDGRMIVIEMNPRVSRSSALASKATGFPIAKLAALLAVGYALDELENDITKCTPASFEPSIDYVVTKMPRFSFEKFPGAEASLTTAMKSVGEVMALGRNFTESLQKALRSMEIGLTGLNTPLSVKRLGEGDDMNVLRAALAQTTPDRLLVAAEALRVGMTVREIYDITGFDPWFLEQIQQLVKIEAVLKTEGLPDNADGWRYVKSHGFGDARLSQLTGTPQEEVTRARRAVGVRPVYKRVDTCAGEFDSITSYMYSTYENPGEGAVVACEAHPSEAPKVIILGSGPNRIGQGVEFDYSCCHAAYALKERGIETIMINCNPETVSTDYDTADRLYFDPLTEEDVPEIIHKEASVGKLLGVIVQLGGQTPLKLTKILQKENIPVLGTSPDNIDLAEDRERFKELLTRLDLKQPENGLARTKQEAFDAAEAVGYPVVIRPSYVLGGRAMEIIRNREQLERYIEEAVTVSGENPVLIDKYLHNATETDVDAIGDGENVYICGVMEHIEEAGVHSGDSGCSLPPYSLTDDVIERLKAQTRILTKALDVKGFINIQFAITEQPDGQKDIYILEANPRASRTVPFTAKVTGVPVVKIASRVMAGERLKTINPGENKRLDYIAVKEAVFPFSRFPGVDTLLGPEMRSTGEVMGIDKTFTVAFLKSQIGANSALPSEGNIFISVRDADKPGITVPARKLATAGYKLYATRGTAEHLERHGVEVKRVNKVLEGRPHIADMIRDGEIAMVINTVEGAQSVSDSFSIRQSALYMKIPYYTTLEGAKAAAGASALLRSGGELEVSKIQDYYAA